MSHTARNLLFICLVCTWPAAAEGQARHQLVRVTAPDISMTIDVRTLSVQVRDGFILAPPGEPALPWLCVFLGEKMLSEQCKVRLIAVETDTVNLTMPISQVAPGVETRDEPVPVLAALPTVGYTAHVYPAENIRIQPVAVWQGQPVTSVYWCPFEYYPLENRLLIIRRGVLVISSENDSTSLSLCAVEELAVDGERDLATLYRSTVAPLSLARVSDFPSGRTVDVGVPTGVDYVIITSGQLLSSMRPLADWRQKQGYRAGIALVSEIERAYAGEDTPAKIRAYLADAYAGGLRFCVLGGDETAVPIRYAYHAYSDTMPASDKMQICDLYYADLNGDWDTDGDHIYGEYLQDQADLFPEIYVGRLLAADAQQAEAIVNKIIAYETTPGDGDHAYLTRAMFTCADQMRDWNGGEGQHTIIGASFPGSFTLDLTSQSENPLGSLPDPALPEGAQFVQQAGTGWGWTVILNHGRTDGFVLRAAGINEWPKSYVWSSGSDGDGHGHLNLLSANNAPGIFLSVACNIGGFDMDGPLFGGFYGPNVAELLLHKPTGGAVAVIAYSRWGWVASSYRIIAKCVEYAFDPAMPQLGAAFALAKAGFPYYRDQNFGLNLYGDPAMPQWTGPPQTMNVDFPAQVAAGSGAVEFTAMNNENPLSGVTITAVYADTVFFSGQTDDRGTATWTAGPDRLGGYDITAAKPGFLPVQSRLITPIASGFDEGEGHTLPLTLEQNHPNPFNPATTIAFSMPIADHVRLDVYDILGRRVSTLADDIIPAGRHELEFTGEQINGSPLASGVYFYRLQVGNQTRIRKMVLLR